MSTEQYQIQDNSQAPSISNSLSSPSKEKEGEQYLSYGYRWLIIFFYATAYIGSGIAMIGFSAVAASIANIYDTPEIAVTLTIVMFFLAYFIMYYPTVVHIQKYGLRVILVGTTIVTITFSWLRSLIMIWDNFWIVVVFTVPIALAQPYYNNITGLIPTVWFPAKEQVLATSIGYTGFFVGMFVGFFIPNFFLANAEYSTPEEIAQGQKDFENYLLFENALITLLGVPIIFIARDKPPTPPSQNALTVKEEKLEVWKNLKALMKNRDYVLLILIFTFLHAIQSALGSAISFITEPYGYTTVDNSILADTLMISGIIASIVLGYLLDKYPKYKITMLILCWGTSIIILAYLVVLPMCNMALTTILIFFAGLALLPISSISLALAVKLTYPIPESMSCGLLVCIGEIWGFLLGLIATYESSAISPLVAVVTFAISSSIAGILAFFINVDKALAKKDKLDLKIEENDFDKGYQSNAETTDKSSPTDKKLSQQESDLTSF